MEIICNSSLNKRLTYFTKKKSLGFVGLMLQHDYLEPNPDPLGKKNTTTTKPLASQGASLPTGKKNILFFF